ncbi:exonuclease domain-containing protein [Nonomuraea sp. SYSU D8015]|uniref:exonuclease domain-containing protein n=1 Tax=Nonomuraea sp. SYSU D8015 TaxID=2593644 RepID=UPI001660A879|nr:exonuclease domain-containing protein [Nonomuraea sp. SYSU D8015]
MTFWTGRLAALDFESTGVDPNEARIVEAYIGLVGGGEKPVDRPPLYIDPGVPMPAEAAAIHGYDDAFLAVNGVEPAEGIGQIVAAVKSVWQQGIPLVGHNIGNYDLTLLDREMVRHGFGPLINLMGGSYGPVIDTKTLSKHIDKWRRKVSEEQKAHALKTCAQVFGIRWVDEEAHGARYDAIISARIAWRMGTIAALPREQRPFIQAGRGDDRHLFDDLNVPLDELFARQQRWAREQAASYQEYLRSPKAGDKRDEKAVIDGSWPVQAAPTTETQPATEAIAS